MHPNNWAVAQGHMLGTEPCSVLSLATYRSLPLAPLEEVSGSAARECPFTMSSAAQSGQFKT